MSIEIHSASPTAFPESANPARPTMRSVLRGALERCPACGDGRLFSSYLKVAPLCGSCGEELHHHRADDAPPYFTMFIVGHLLVPAAFLVEKTWHPEIWVHMVLWLPLCLLLTLMLLPRVKGSIVGLQWALRMHGFDMKGSDEEQAGAHAGGL